MRNAMAYRLLAGLAIAAGVWKGVSALLEKEVESPVKYCDDPRWVNPCPKYVEGRPCEGPCEMREVQGQRLAVAASEFARSEKENVWKKDCYETTTFDTIPAQGNYAALKPEQVAHAISRNVARIIVRSDSGNKMGHATCVGGHLWVTCKHFFVGDHEYYDSRFIFETPSEGCSRNMEIRLFKRDLLFHPTKDQVWFEARGLEVKKDITSLISKPSLDGCLDGFLVSYDKNYCSNQTRAQAVVKVEMIDPHTQKFGKFWRMYSERDTINGDCGAPLVYTLLKKNMLTVLSL